MSRSRQSRSRQPHLVRTPAAPTFQQTHMAEFRRCMRDLDRKVAGVQYRTGPRFGQRLAEFRRAASNSKA